MSKKLFLDRSVETFGKTICSRCGYTCFPMLNTIEFKVDFIVVMSEPPAVFPAIICQNGFYLQSMLLIEGEYVVMKDECRMIGQLARVQVTEHKKAIGVDGCLHVDFSHFLEFARIEGVLTKQVALLSTCLSLKQGLAFSMDLICSSLSCFPWMRCWASCFKNRW